MAHIRVTTIVHLAECDHKPIYHVHHKPKPGDLIYCYKCNDARTVTYNADEWRIRCTQCRYGRAYGTDETGARMAASKHGNRHDHRVRLIKGQKILGEISAAGLQSPF